MIKKKHGLSGEGAVPTFSDLLINTFNQFSSETKPDLSAHEQEAMYASSSQMILGFTTFVENRFFFQEMRAQVIGAVKVAFNSCDFSLIAANYPNKIVKLRAHIFDVVLGFYLEHVFEYVCNSYATCEINDREIEIFDSDFKRLILSKCLPIANIVECYPGFNEVYIFNLISSFAEYATYHLSSLCCVQIHIKFLMEKCEEVSDTKDAVVLNALWIINEIEVRFNNEISNWSKVYLLKQIEYCNAGRYMTFECIYHFFNLKKIERPTKLKDLNDLFLLLVVTNSKNLASLPLNKGEIISAINTPLMLHSILYACLILANDDPISLQVFVEQFSSKHMSSDQYLPNATQMLALVDTSDQYSNKITIAKRALNKMLEFVMRITDHRLVYEVSEQFYERCKKNCSNLSQKSSDLHLPMLPLFSSSTANAKTEFESIHGRLRYF